MVDLSRLDYGINSGEHDSAAFHRGLEDCIDVLRGSQLFSYVDSQVVDPDFYLTGEAHFDLEQSIGGAIVSGLTLAIFPVPIETRRWHIKVRFMNARSRRSLDVDLEETTRTWWGLMLFPITPFRAPFLENPQAKKRMCRSLAFALHEAMEEFEAEP